LDSAHQKPLKTAKTVQKVFDGSQNADLCNLYYDKTVRADIKVPHFI